MRIVIDTCITGAASTRQIGGQASTAVHILEAVADGRHEFVYCPGKMREEWDRHRSNYSSTWLRHMFGKKRVCEDLSVDLPVLRRAISLLPESENACATKDLHLVEAAISFDNVLVSWDHGARTVYSSLRTSQVELNRTLWADPLRDRGVPQWILTGARSRRDLLL